jgi:hypothetical protein
VEQLRIDPALRPRRLGHDREQRSGEEGVS